MQKAAAMPITEEHAAAASEPPSGLSGDELKPPHAIATQQTDKPSQQETTLNMGERFEATDSMVRHEVGWRMYGQQTKVVVTEMP